MKSLKFLFAGLFFGILLMKGQVISWFRIYEMFRFQSIHMYGVIGSAVILGIIGIWLMKRFRTKDIEGNPIEITPKEIRYSSNLIGGTIFGLGWALTGACPGPMFALFGGGIWVFGIVILSATFGTFCYGLLKEKLQH